MNGINISQARAAELAAWGIEVYLSPESGFWARVDGLDPARITYHVRRTGDVVSNIPEGAFPFGDFPMTVAEAAGRFGISYQTLMSAAKAGRLEAWRSGSSWLTTPSAVERFRS